MKTILIPTDFSENAIKAMKYAAAFFEDERCHFILVNSYYATPASVDAVGAPYLEPLGEVSRNELRKNLAVYKEFNHHSDSSFEMVSTFGEISNVLSDLDENRTIDYIIMGTKGASGVAEVLMGSNAASVIKKVKCPVICVPEKATFKKPEKIVFATDYEEIIDESSLEPMRALAKKFEAKILVLNVKSAEAELVTGEEAIQGLRLNQSLTGIEHDFHYVTADKVEQGIQDYAKGNNADLIAALKRENTFWERLFNRSVTKKMAFHTEVPLLVLHEKVTE